MLNTLLKHSAPPVVSESVYKDRYEKVRKELGFLKQQLQHQHEEELQQEQNLKKHLEKKVSILKALNHNDNKFKKKRKTTTF